MMHRNTQRPQSSVAGYRRNAIGLAVASLFLAGAVLSAHAQTADTPATTAASVRDYDIPAGPLSPALSRFAGLTGVTLSTDAALTEGHSTQGMRGRYGIADGFAQLLRGSGLRAVALGGGVYRLERLPVVQSAAGDAATLPAMTVVGQLGRADGLLQAYAGGQVARGGRLGFLGNADVMDAPLSTVSYTAQMVEDQQARTIGDVLINDASVRLSSQANGVAESFYIRGFPINEGNIGDLSFDGLYGVAPNYQASSAYAERIELIKGPTALLGGMAPNGALGGSLNIVPKRAGSQPLTRLTLDYATRSQLGTHLDVGRRFGEKQEWGIRANGLYRNGDTERDKQSAKTLLGALALDYRGSRLRASVDYIDQRVDADALSRQPMLAAGAAVPAAPDPRRNLSQPWDYSTMRDRLLFARAEYDFSEQLTGYVAAGASRGAIEGVYGNPVMDGTGATNTVPARLSFDIRKQAVEAGLRGTLRTGAVEHRWNLGLNAYHGAMDVGFNFATTALGSNIYNPANYPVMNLAKPDRMGYSRTTLRGLALADTLVFADDRVLLTLGLRHQQVLAKSPMTGTRYDEDALTPMLGLVVKPRADLSLFANYIQGLSVGETAPTSALNAGEVFAPYKTKQYEAGVKHDAGNWLATASIFQISKPSGQMNANGYYRPDAEQRNRGLELTLAGEPVRGLRPMLGLTWTQGKLTQASSAVQGNKAPGVPSFQANLGLEWDVPQVPGLTLTGRALHACSQYVNQANTQRLPAWSRLDVGARYATRIAGRPVALRLQVLNLTDKYYWSGVNSWGGLSMGDARTVRLSAQIDF